MLNKVDGSSLAKNIHISNHPLQICNATQKGTFNMERGLDELIEWLLTEIAFSGLEGFSAEDLIKAIKAFYTVDIVNEASHSQSRADLPSRDVIDAQQIGPEDIAHASVVWKWLLSSKDVTIDIRYKNMSLEDVLAEGEDQAASITTTDTSPSTANPAQAGRPPPAKKRRSGSLEKTEPAQGRRGRETTSRAKACLHLSDDRLWKTIAGHGPDLKRVPQFEWRALVAIASAREQGILQGDLVRLTGQDKRSLPMRTEALARKGYIIKQPYMLRGCRTSKLWLSQFAEKAQELSQRVGLPLEEIDLSKEALSKNFDPLPFSNYWTGEHIDYVALGQAFIAVARAWGLSRYSDLRKQLDVEEKVPQMRALAKSSRWFANVGVIEFTPAKFENNYRVFKDCVHFLRDPTQSEWRRFRATPKAHMTAPSTRRKGKSAESGTSTPLARSKIPREDPVKLRARRAFWKSLPSPDRIKLSSWTPYKPMTNTIFEIIKRSGTQGVSNPDIGTFTVGWQFRKYIASLTSLLSQTRDLPENLQPFKVTSQFNRLGRANIYQFFALPDSDSQDVSVSEPSIKRLGQQTEENQPETIPPISNIVHRFPQLPASQFSERAAEMLTQIGPRYTTRPGPKSKRRLSIESESSVAPQAKRARQGKSSFETATEETQIQNNLVPQLIDTSTHQQSKDIEIGGNGGSEEAMPHANAPLRPGVYRGKPNSIGPVRKARGRQRRSLVLIFRSAALRNPKSFLQKSSAITSDINLLHASLLATEPGNDIVPSHEKVSGSSMPSGPDQRSQPLQNTTGTNPSPPLAHDGNEQGNNQILSGPAASMESKSDKKRNGRKSMGPRLWVCEKCGNSWKNNNGLEYHQTKSQTSCNPQYIPPPVVPKIEKASKTKPNEVETRNLLPSKRPSLAGRFAVPINQLSNASTSDEVHKLTPDQGAVVLNSVSLHNVPDSLLLPATSRAASAIAGRPASSPQKATNMIKPLTPKGQNQGLQHAVVNDPIAPVDSVQPSSHLPAVGQVTSHEPVHASGSTHHSGLNEDNTSTEAEPTQTSTDLGPSSGPPLSTTDTVSNVDKIAPMDLSLLLPSQKKARTAGLDRTIGLANIIQDLLAKSDGVLPGDRSLYMMIESMWPRRFETLELPDWKTCQEVLTKMAKAGFIKEEYFGFINQKGRTTTCSVISRLYPEGISNEALFTTIAHKVAEVKDKSRELHPNLYIPPWFPLYLKELDSVVEFNMGGTVSHQSPRPRQKTKAQVLIMDYKPPVDKSVKTRLSASGPVSELPKRRNRKETSGLDNLSPLPSRKLQKGTPTGVQDGRAKRLPFASSQQQLDARWLPGRTYLQNPSSGAWSWIPPAPLRAEVELDRIRRRVYRDLIAAARLDRDLTDAALDDLMPDVQNAMAASTSVQILEPSTSASFQGDEAEFDDEEEEDDEEDTRGSASLEVEGTVYEADAEPIVTRDNLSPFTSVTRIEPDSDGVWPTKFPRQFFEDKFGGSFTMVGHFPTLSWFLRQNLPQSAAEIIDNNDRNSVAPNSTYGKFIRDVSKIGAWELSPEGIYLQYRGSIAPEYIFISLSGVPSGENLRPIQLEWPHDLQYTVKDIPDEIVEAASDDEDITTLALTAGHKVDNLERLLKDDQPPRKRRKRKTAPRPVRLPGLRRETLYKTRFLLDVPKSNTRWTKFNKHKAVGDDLGLEGQHELVVAFVVIKTLVGGVDKVIDWGRIMKLFPHMSLSGLRRTWAQLSKERKNFMTAFCDKFQTAFLEAYEKGEVPALDYDDLDSYDWKGIVKWAAKLETHEKLKLPVTRKKFDNDNTLENIEDPDQDWRDSWFHHQASVFIRMDAAAGEPMAVPRVASSELDPDGDELKVARSWIRALCNNNEREPVGQEVRDRLLSLGSKREKASLNAILSSAVEGLFSDKVICKVKNTKATRQVYKLNNNFTNRANKLSNVDKFVQAAAFKTELDERLRSRGEAIVPFAADSGTIIAIVNLQASGRIRTEAIDYPQVPFGFEPGNYEGRQFPKHYYHFQVKVLPTDKYIYDEDLPVLEAAADQPIPDKSSIGEIPLWFDFFENLDRARWVQCLCSVVFATATKGPTNVEGLVGLLRPCLEPFEIVLIYEWLDRLGLMTSVTGSQGWSVGEWWWLVVGKQAQRNEKGKGKAIASS